MGFPFSEGVSHKWPLKIRNPWGIKKDPLVSYFHESSLHRDKIRPLRLGGVSNKKWFRNSHQEFLGTSRHRGMRTRQVEGCEIWIQWNLVCCTLECQSVSHSYSCYSCSTLSSGRQSWNKERCQNRLRDGDIESVRMSEREMKLHRCVLRNPVPNLFTDKVQSLWFAELSISSQRL